MRYLAHDAHGGGRGFLLGELAVTQGVHLARGGGVEGWRGGNVGRKKCGWVEKKAVKECCEKD